MKFTLSKQERLKHNKLIEKLYQEGEIIKVFPLKMKYLQVDHQANIPAQVGITVSKRNIGKAVVRNTIKRRLRESYRLQKYIVYDALEQPYIYMISYLAKEPLEYGEIAQRMKKLLLLFTDKVTKK